MKGALPPVTQSRIIGLSAGYLGLQITFGIESASLSRIYQGFGAGVEDLALLWLAGPVSGLLVQPVIGGNHRDCCAHRDRVRAEPGLGNRNDLAARNLDERP